MARAPSGMKVKGIGGPSGPAETAQATDWSRQRFVQELPKIREPAAAADPNSQAKGAKDSYGPDLEPGTQVEFDFETGPTDPIPDESRREAAEQGDMRAQFQLAQEFRYGVSGVSRSLVQALVWYKAAEARGHPDAAWNVAAVTRAISETELAEAEYLIGSMLWESTRVHPRRSEAVDWFRKAAKRGHAEAQRELGQIHEASDPITAYAWYNAAAKQGDQAARSRMPTVRDRLSEAEFSRACLALGTMYRGGVAIPRDAGEALYWYREAAKSGLPEAEFGMGEIYRNGEAVAANDREAFNWHLKAAGHGFSSAQREVGEMYLNGEGTPKRPVEGLAWLLAAALNGSEDAKASSRFAKRQMTDEETLRAERRCSELIERDSREG